MSESSQDAIVQEFTGRLSEVRARYTGKDPFDPWTQLNRLYASLNEEGRVVLCRFLRERESDPFWSRFIALFIAEDPSRCTPRE